VTATAVAATPVARGLLGVTFDWWGTLYLDRSARSQRVQLIRHALHEHGYTSRESAVMRAYDIAAARFNREWADGRVYPSKRWLRDILDELGVSLPAADCLELQRALEGAMLDSPPPLIPGAARLLRDLHENGVRLGVISDTGLTVGRVMRRLLAKDGLLDYFSGLAFSDEIGVTKPNEQAFRRALAGMDLLPEQAVHIGDLPNTDVCGAKAVGMKAILINGISGRQDECDADAVVCDYAALRQVLRDWGLLP
jgi:HAD superfamily hydrolase (TIGR01549 family)